MGTEKILCIADLEEAASKILPTSTRGKERLLTNEPGQEPVRGNKIYRFLQLRRN